MTLGILSKKEEVNDFDTFPVSDYAVSFFVCVLFWILHWLVVHIWRIYLSRVQSHLIILSKKFSNPWLSSWFSWPYVIDFCYVNQYIHSQLSQLRFSSLKSLLRILRVTFFSFFCDCDFSTSNAQFILKKRMTTTAKIAAHWLDILSHFSVNLSPSLPLSLSYVENTEMVKRPLEADTPSFYPNKVDTLKTRHWSALESLLLYIRLIIYSSLLGVKPYTHSSLYASDLCQQLSLPLVLWTKYIKVQGDY